jgi:hypothetical protein
MTPEQACKILTDKTSLEIGRFYGSSDNLNIGVGLLYRNIRCPVFDISDQLFNTVEGLVYVITHECDIDQNNKRPFNDYLSVCPLINLEDFLVEYENEFKDDEALKNFLDAVAGKQVSRIVYLPPISPYFKYGAFLYLNNLVGTHISAFAKKNAIGALSVFGLQIVDFALENHLLRPKSEQLSLYRH